MRNEVIVMCIILIIVSGGFPGDGWRPSIQNKCFLIYTAIVIKASAVASYS